MTNISSFYWKNCIVNLSDRCIIERENGKLKRVEGRKQFAVGPYCVAFIGTLNFDPMDLISELNTRHYPKMDALASQLVDNLNSKEIPKIKDNAVGIQIAGYDETRPNFYIVRNYKYATEGKPEINMPLMLKDPDCIITDFFERNDWKNQIPNWYANGIFPWTIFPNTTFDYFRHAANQAPYWLSLQGLYPVVSIEEAASVALFQSAIIMYHCLNPRTVDVVSGGTQIVVQYPDRIQEEKYWESSNGIVKCEVSL